MLSKRRYNKKSITKNNKKSGGALDETFLQQILSNKNLTSYRDEYGKRYEITVGDHDTYTSQHQISHDICRQFPDIQKYYKIHILHTDAELKAFVAYRLVEKLEYENEMILSKEKIRRLMDNNRFLIAFLNFLRSSLKTGILVHIENEIVKAHRSKNGEISELLKTGSVLRTSNGTFVKQSGKETDKLWEEVVRICNVEDTGPKKESKRLGSRHSSEKK